MNIRNFLVLVGCGLWTIGCAQSHSINASDGVDAGELSQGDSGQQRTMGDAGQRTLPDGSVSERPIDSCRPMRVETLLCGGCDTHGPSFFYWDGTRCVTDSVVSGCDCKGEDCDKTYSSLAACEEAQAHCEPERCSSTGGRWAMGCVSRCGRNNHQDIDCDGETPLCICPIGHSWGDDGSGCIPDADCNSDDACLATGGRLDVHDSGCICPPGLNGELFQFIEDRGCVLASNEPPCITPAACEGAIREYTCRATGGIPKLGATDPVCGVVRDLTLPAEQQTCDCGPWKVFDNVKGCVESDECLVRRIGQGGCSEPAGADSFTTCEPDSICQDDSCQPLMCSANGDVAAGCSELRLDKRATEASECTSVVTEMGCCGEARVTAVRVEDQARTMAWEGRCRAECNLDVLCTDDKIYGWTLDDGSFVFPGDTNVSIVVRDGQCMTTASIAP